MEFIMLLAMGITTDIWTSNVSPMSMQSLTAQWVEKDFVLKPDCMLKNVLVLILLLQLNDNWEHV
jgi:hypothetical protein